LNHKYNIFNDEAKSIVFTANYGANYGNSAEVIQCTDLMQIVKTLYDKKIQSLIVEGGTDLLNSFIKLELWDEIITFTGDFLLKKGVEDPNLPDMPAVCETLGSNFVRLLSKQ
jgi:diaminohydroxyphosphoribosylaminopyrimidine deaminase/5-amino-6-(5-phosphoribosylamino)uracil reductase